MRTCVFPALNKINLFSFSFLYLCGVVAQIYDTCQTMTLFTNAFQQFKSIYEKCHNLALVTIRATTL